MSDRLHPDQKVAVVTGGAGGIGAAIAEELGRAGSFVVTVDPVVSVDGSETLEAPAETTADRIVAGGGAARSSSISVTDADAVHALFGELVQEFGGVDAVVNVAGISRPSGFASGDPHDWTDVLSVHLDGYLNILRAALPVMAATGRGRILGVTSGSGWRPADTGAYGCAKRAVASLTWQLGAAVPGVAVNALSPIAATRMVAAALGRTAGDTSRSRTGGLSLGSMPSAEDLGPIGAHLVDEEFAWCRGRVLFSGGSELAVIDEPRLVEVVRTQHVGSLADVLDAVTERALVPAEQDQRTNGGSNSRFGPIFEGHAETSPPSGPVRSCAIAVADDVLCAEVRRAAEQRSIRCIEVPLEDDFDRVADVLARVNAEVELDAVVVGLAATAPRVGDDGWTAILGEHEGIAGGIRADAAWARGVADLAAAGERPMRLVSLVDATTAGGRSRAQAAAQHSRSALGATDGRVSAHAISVEADGENGAVGELVAHLLCTTHATELSGAELAVGSGWLGLRRHPRPEGTIVFGGPAVPGWVDTALRQTIPDGGGRS